MSNTMDIERKCSHGKTIGNLNHPYSFKFDNF